jgi:hypothetical protein
LDDTNKSETPSAYQYMFDVLTFCWCLMSSCNIPDMFLSTSNSQGIIK